MENPDAYRAGKDLVEFEWRQNHRNFYRSFSLKFYQENDMPLLIGWFPSQSGDDEIRENQTDAFSNPIPGSSHGYSGLSFRMCWQSRIFRRTENRLLTAMMKLTAKSGSFGAPTMGKRPKRSAAVKRRRWRPWCWALPRKHILHQA